MMASVLLLYTGRKLRLKPCAEYGDGRFFDGYDTFAGNQIHRTASHDYQKQHGTDG